MIGKPKFRLGDVVSFTVVDNNYQEHTLMGTIEIVDAYGTFNQNEEVSYDIFVKNSHYSGEPCLYKHIIEPFVKKA